MLSRRDLLSLAGLLAVPAAGAATAGSAERSYACQFKARATVLMLSVPLLHRDNVGSGYFRVAEREEAGRRHLRLEFGAGSLPERAAGLNRLGVFEETIVESGGRLESAAYFGFMTASNEKNLDQARSALKAGSASSYTAIRGRIDGARLSNRLLRIADLAASSWAGRDQLMSQIRARLADETAPAMETAVNTSGEPCSTFLYAVNCAMRSADAACRCRFVHNGQIHQLVTERKEGGKPGVILLDGRIQSGDGKDLSSFRLWFEPGQPQLSPLRFEFRPRSFLRLTFERV